MTDRRSDVPHGILRSLSATGASFLISVRDLTTPFDPAVRRCVEGQRGRYIGSNVSNWGENDGCVAYWGVPMVSERDTEYEAGPVTRTATDVPFSLTIDIDGSVLISRLGIDPVNLTPSPSINGVSQNSIPLDYNQPTRVQHGDVIEINPTIPGKPLERWSWAYNAEIYAVRTARLPRIHLYQEGGKLIRSGIALRGREDRLRWGRRLERDLIRLGRLGITDIASYQKGSLEAEYASSSDGEEEESGRVNGEGNDDVGEEGEIEGSTIDGYAGERSVWRPMGHKGRGQGGKGERDE